MFTAVGYIIMDHLSRKICYTNCVQKVKICKILNGVLLFTICIYESCYRLVVFGAMGYCIFTGDVGVHLCCCSVEFNLMSSVDVNTMESQSVHSIL